MYYIYPYFIYINSFIYINFLAVINILLVRCLQDVSQKRLQDTFKTSARRFEDVFNVLKNIFKASSRRFEDIFKTSCKYIFKTFSRRIIKLNCSC